MRISVGTATFATVAGTRGSHDTVVVANVGQAYNKLVIGHRAPSKGSSSNVSGIPVAAKSNAAATESFLSEVSCGSSEKGRPGGAEVFAMLVSCLAK